MASYEQFLQKQENLSAILTALRTNGPMTRALLSERTGLSWGCISELTSELIERALITEEKAQDFEGKGRKPQLLDLNRNNLFVGVDINTVGLHVCVCDMTGAEIAMSRYGLSASDETELIDAVVRAIEASVFGCNRPILGIGIAMQGIFERNLNTWLFPMRARTVRIDIEQAVRARLGIAVIVEHDPNCLLFGYAEANNCKRWMMVRLDNGVGVSICKNGSFFDGGALELGYVSVEGEKRLQDYICLRDVEKMAARQAAGDADAALYMRDIGRHLGTALGNLCNLIHVDEIILCGEMMKYKACFQAQLLKYYQQTVLPSEEAVIQSVDITHAAYGAAKLAVERFPYRRESVVYGSV